jgi:hypothetical protein
MTLRLGASAAMAVGFLLLISAMVGDLPGAALGAIMFTIGLGTYAGIVGADVGYWITHGSGPKTPEQWEDLHRSEVLGGVWGGVSACGLLTAGFCLPLLAMGEEAGGILAISKVVSDTGFRLGIWGFMKKMMLPLAERAITWINEQAQAARDRQRHFFSDERKTWAQELGGGKPLNTWSAQAFRQYQAQSYQIAIAEATAYNNFSPDWTAPITTPWRTRLY